MSAGGTAGTQEPDDFPLLTKIIKKYLMMPVVMPITGMVHQLETGAKRFADGIPDE